jgi:hypothetical protein
MRGSASAGRRGGSGAGLGGKCGIDKAYVTTASLRSPEKDFYCAHKNLLLIMLLIYIVKLY